uniref:Uncharacterized protein n=1 Tax=Tanacetum cinerariifolium TaxID=118510 RepID=A0A6L2MY83_TANCI|nr:hypothetical protein [Tanacetum cinerariifolium]
MSSITTQQEKLNLELVPKEKRLEIGKCNGRLNPRKIQKEPTFQVVLDAIALTPCYSAFLITADVTEGQDFDALPTDDEIMSFLRELRHTEEINSLSDSTKSLGKVKESKQTPERGVVIRETPEMPLSKKKEKMIVEKRKGIDLLFEVSLTIEAQFKEVQKKSMRDFYKTRPSGSGTVAKIAPSVAKIKSSATSKGTGVKPGVLNVAEEESFEKHETDESESSSESDHDESEEEDEDNEEARNHDKAEGDEDEEMDYTTSQLYDDMDIMLNEPVYTNKGFVQEEGTDVAMTNVQQGNENPEILQVTSSSHSLDLAAKFLKFLSIPHIDAKVVSLMDVHVHHEVPSQQTPKLLTLPILVISDSSPVFTTVILQSLPSFTLPP